MSSSQPTPPKVFISYSHDSSEHLDRVLTLADRLRAEGIDCNLDQYEPAPAEGWPRWMDKQFEDADFILVICTETYCRRFEGREERGKGLGVKWEGAIISDELYSNEAVNKRFIPVLFSDDDAAHVPQRLRHYMRHLITDSEGYEGLYRHLTNQPRVIKPPVGTMRLFKPINRLPSLQPEQRQQNFTTIEETNSIEELDNSVTNAGIEPKSESVLTAVVSRPVLDPGTTRFEADYFDPSESTELLNDSTDPFKKAQGSSIENMPQDIAIAQPWVSKPRPRVNRLTHKSNNRRWWVMLGGLSAVTLLIIIIVISMPRSSLKKEGNLSDPEINAAFARHLEGHTDEARTRLNASLTANPANAEALYCLGRIDLYQKKYDDAVTRLMNAAKLDAKLPDVWAYLAMGYLGLGQPRNARDALLRIEIGSSPKDPELKAAFARHLERHTDEARTRISAVLTANPTNAEALYYLGRIDLYQEKYDDAVTRLKEAARLDAKLPDVWAYLATAYLGMGQSRNALDTLDRIAESSIKP